MTERVRETWYDVARAQGVGEIMNQMIGQAGPALKLARETLGQTSDNGRAPEPTEV